MTVERIQCVATTTKGTRCQLYAQPNDELCHIHVKRRIKNKVHEKEKVVDRKTIDKKKMKPRGDANPFTKKMYSEYDNKPGNIYVFTYAHMMNAKPTKTPYLKSAAPTNNNWIDYNNTTLFDTADKILLKIGYTRKRPDVRVEEWRQQCGHSDFILIYPGCLVPTYNTDMDKSVNKLTSLFKKLVISKNEKQTRANYCSTGRIYANLNEEKTCFVSKNPYQTEQKIHRVLREKYGNGKLYCDGCSRNKIDENSGKLVTKVSGVHTEWFLIPRVDMHLVWEMIEYHCR